jgi:uncharacterized protein YukE
MANEGLNIAAVERISRSLRAEAANIGSLIGRVSNSVARADQNWDGTDSRRFVDGWNGTHRRALEQIKQSLERLASTAANEAAQQRRISS